MANFLYLFWRIIKNFFKLLFWLLLLGVLVVFIIWILGKVHPVFDIGVDHWLLKIWIALKNLIIK